MDNEFCKYCGKPKSEKRDLDVVFRQATEALDKCRREFLSMKQSLQRGVQPHELSDQIKRCEFDVEQAIAEVYGPRKEWLARLGEIDRGFRDWE